MNRWKPVVTALSILLAPTGMARAQITPNVTGAWSIQMQATMPPPAKSSAPAAPCDYQGTTNVVQSDNQFTGHIFVELTSGGAGCPSSMFDSVSGNVSGNQITMGAVAGAGDFGVANFTGSVATAPPRSAATTTGTTINGTFSVIFGPFSGTTGTWSAVSVQPSEAVPALGTWGLAALSLLLLGAAARVLRRQETASRLR